MSRRQRNSSSSDSTEEETPRPGETVDFDFFDSDKNDEHSKTITKPSHKDDRRDVLHGSLSENSPGGRISGKSKHSNQRSKDTFTSSTKIEIRRSYTKGAATTPSPTPPSKEKITVRLPREPVKHTKDSSSDSDSDSMTDVSPILSSGETPRQKESDRDVVKEKKHPKKSPNNIIKNGHDGNRPPSRRGDGDAISIEDLFYSSESSQKSSDEREIAMHKRKRVHRKRKPRYNEVQHRSEASSRQHRRRLLDAAAENSMDLSQLLEVVLEMEQKNKAQKMYPASGGTKGQLHLPLKPPRRKNMSFSNEKVLDIDSENQRLLKRLSQMSNRQQRPSSASSVRSSASSCRSSASTSRSSRRPFTASFSRISPNRGPRVYHSATNRLRDQQRIERENLLLLKRLQTAKSSNDLRREYLLRDYERQTGRPANPVPRSAVRRRQRVNYSRNSDCENESIQNGHHKARPVWQDSW